jgi:hypothetical protein
MGVTQGKPGRPQKLTQSDAERIINEIRYAYDEVNPLTQNKVTDLILAAVEKNYRANHPHASRAEALDKTTICDRTEQAFIKSIRAGAPQAQYSTQAACECIRHTFTWAVAHAAYCKFSPAHLKINADATTTCINMKSLREGSIVIVPLDDAPNSNGKKSKGRAQTYQSNEMATIVKHVIVTSASGQSDGACMIVMDKTVPDGQFHYFELKQFTCVTGVMKTGV